MRLSYIELRNYRRFEHVKLELPDGIVGIIGNNGVGKSTLVESIAWALFGNQKDIVRVSKESVRRDGARANEPTTVRLEFTFGGDEYVVTRGMSGKALTIDASLLVNGKSMAQGSTEVSSYIEKKFGMDYKSFFISVFAKQKDLAALSSLTPSDRRMTVLRMLGIYRLDDIIDNVSRTERLGRDRVDSARTALGDEQGNPRQEALMDKRRRLIEEQSVLDRSIADTRKEQDICRQSEMDIESRLDEITGTLKSLRDAIGKLQLDRNLLDALKKNYEQSGRHLEEAERAMASKGKLSGLNYEIRKVKERVEKLSSARTDFEKLHGWREDLKTLDKEFAAAETDIARKSDDAEKYSGLAESMNENAQGIAEIQKEVEALRDRQSELREQIRGTKKTISTDEEHLSDVNRLGPEGICPTCERPLREHHGILKDKLASSIRSSKDVLAELESSLKETESKLTEKNKALEALKRKSEAFTKRERHFAQIEKEIELAEKSKRTIEGKGKKIRSEIDKIGPVRFDQKEFEEKKAILEELDSQRDLLLGLASIAERAPELKKSTEKLRLDIRELEKSIQEQKIDPTEVELLEKTASNLSLKRSELRKKSDGYYESILAITKQKERIDSEIIAAGKEIDSLESMKKKLGAMEEDLAYSAKLHELMADFRLNIVARIIPMLSDIASALLAQLTEGRYSSLTLDDGYNIFIEDEGERYILERFSGGESDLANLCLRLAISRVIAERTSTEGINLLVLDEIFGSQDAFRKKNLMTSFQALSKQFRQIFLITHIDDIREYLSSVIEVYQDEGGTSYARLV
jgi:exonuclease SbcC